MKFAILVLIAIYSIFVLVVGETAQKGMLLSLLALVSLILLFYKYSNVARMMNDRYHELKRAVFTADEMTGFIKLLEERTGLNTDKVKEPGIELSHAIGILRRAKLRAGLSSQEESVQKDIRVLTDETPPTTQPPQPTQ